MSFRSIFLRLLFRAALVFILYLFMAVVAAEFHFYRWPLWYRALFLFAVIVDTVAGVQQAAKNVK